MYNRDQISRGVNPQRVAEYKQKTENTPGSLKLKTIVRLSFVISLIAIFCIYNMYC